MDTSLRLAATDTAAAAAQALRQPRAAGSTPPAAEAGTPVEAAVQVSISAEARAAAALPPAEAAEAAGATPPVSAPSAAERPAAAPAATATPGPASDPAAAATPDAVAGARGVATARAQAAEQPDAASASGNQALQLYLDNAERPASQASPTVLRTSA